jgi:hypothetical protein
VAAQAEAGGRRRGAAPDPQADDPARLLVWDVRVGEHIEDLAEQPPAVYLGLGAIDEPQRNFLPCTGIREGQRLVERLHQRIEHLNVGFSQRRQQHRMI